MYRYLNYQMLHKGKGLDYFRNFLNNLSPRLDWDSRKNKDSIYWIDNVYYVKGVGIVISGTVKKVK